MQETAKKAPIIKKNDTILTSGKNGHFAKAVVRQHCQNWPPLGLNLKSENHAKNESEIIHKRDFLWENWLKKKRLKSGKISHSAKAKTVKNGLFWVSALKCQKHTKETVQ